MRTMIKFAFAWVVLAALFAIGLGQLNVPTFLRLVQHGERTTATIVQPNCDSHANASYTFTVASTHYSGTDVMAVDCRSLHPGDTIQIYYDVADPTLNRAGDPKARLENELLTIAGMCLIFPPLIIAGACLGWISKKESKAVKLDHFQ
jgi:hypothetical protein